MKTGAYGINSVTLANPGQDGAYPASWTGNDSFSFKAIVKDSLQFNDSAASDNDIEIEDSDDMYATLPSGAAQKGFTMDTYDLSEDSYKALLQFTDGTGDNEGWVVAPAKSDDLIKAVQIVTRAFDDFPSKTFQWARMKIKVTRAGTLGKSGFPNFHLEFRELANTNAAGFPISGHRWKISNQVSAPVFTPAEGSFTTSVQVSLSCETIGASIYYTDNNSAPSTASTKYTGPITITATKTLKAIAVADGMTDSEVVSKTYTKGS